MEKQLNSKAILFPLVLGDGNAPPAQPAPPANGEPQNPAPPANGDPAKPAEPAPPANGEPPAESLTLTAEELEAIKTSATTAAINAYKAREAAKNTKAQTDAARAQAEKDGDQAALLEVERTEHEGTRQELTTARAEADQSRRELVVYKAAAKFQLDENLTELLANNSRVTDQATAEAEAKKLTAYKKLPEAPPTDGGAGNRPATKAKPKAPEEGGEGKPDKRFSFQPQGGVAWPD